MQEAANGGGAVESFSRLSIRAETLPLFSAPVTHIRKDALRQSASRPINRDAHSANRHVLRVALLLALLLH